MQTTYTILINKNTFMRSDDAFLKNRMISFSVLVFVILTQGN